MQVWKMDSEGVFLCGRCWNSDEEARLYWSSVEIEDDEHPYCEGCGYYPAEGAAHRMWRSLLNKTWNQRWFLKRAWRRAVH